MIGKTASCTAMALTAGAYAWPAHPRVAAVLAEIVLTAVNYRGVAKTAAATRVLVALTLVVLALVLVGCFAGGATDLGRLSPLSGHGAHGVLLEEAGVRVQVEHFSGVYKNMARKIVALVYRCHPVAGAPQPSDESRSVRWLTPSEVRCPSICTGAARDT